MEQFYSPFHLSGVDHQFDLVLFGVGRLDGLEETGDGLVGAIHFVAESVVFGRVCESLDGGGLEALYLFGGVAEHGVAVKVAEQTFPFKVQFVGAVAHVRHCAVPNLGLFGGVDHCPVAVFPLVVEGFLLHKSVVGCAGYFVEDGWHKVHDVEQFFGGVVGSDQRGREVDENGDEVVADGEGEVFASVGQFVHVGAQFAGFFQFGVRDYFLVGHGFQTGAQFVRSLGDQFGHVLPALAEKLGGDARPFCRVFDAVQPVNDV